MGDQFHALPVSGGIYDQDPGLLKEWMIIGGIVAEVRQKELDDLPQADGGGTSDPPRRTPRLNRTPATRKSMSSGKVGGLNFKRVPKVPPVPQGNR